MRRREFIKVIAGSAAWPLAARAQQAQRMRRIGVLMGLAATDAEGQARFAAFLQGLQEFGWSVGRNVIIDTRWSTGNNTDFRKYAMELVALGPDVIMAYSSDAVAPLLQVTRTVPIVFAVVADPVGAGYVDGLARPGWQHHRFYRLRLFDEREMAAAAQGDRPRSNASGGFSRSFHSGRTWPVRRHPSCCAVARSGAASG
jgi:hypothetical protein